jgi:hypothetical protein
MCNLNKAMFIGFRRSRLPTDLIACLWQLGLSILNIFNVLIWFMLGILMILFNDK